MYFSCSHVLVLLLLLLLLLYRRVITCVLKQYASVVQDGEHFMTPGDFVTRYLGLIPKDNYNEKTVRLLGNVVDTTKDGFVNARNI